MTPILRPFTVLGALIFLFFSIFLFEAYLATDAKYLQSKYAGDKSKASISFIKKIQ
jgi:hypothetical protein